MTDLDARYGRTANASKRTRWFAIGAGILFVLVFAAWLWWGGLLGASAQFESRDLGHEVVSPTEVSVTWQFTVQPGTPARCAVQALNASYGIVGWRVIDLPPAEEITTTYTEAIRTAEPAVNGLIYRCWLT